MKGKKFGDNVTYLASTLTLNLHCNFTEIKYCRKGLAGPDSPDLDDSLYLGEEREEGGSPGEMGDYHSLLQHRHQQHGQINMQIPPSLSNFR